MINGEPGPRPLFNHIVGFGGIEGGEDSVT
jgi:hypothetical protein